MKTLVVLVVFAIVSSVLGQSYDGGKIIGYAFDGTIMSNSANVMTGNTYYFPSQSGISTTQVNIDTQAYSVSTKIFVNARPNITYVINWFREHSIIQDTAECAGIPLLGGFERDSGNSTCRSQVGDPHCGANFTIITAGTYYFYDGVEGSNPALTGICLVISVIDYPSDSPSVSPSSTSSASPSPSSTSSASPTSSSSTTSSTSPSSTPSQTASASATVSPSLSSSSSLSITSSASTSISSTSSTTMTPSSSMSGSVSFSATPSVSVSSSGSVSITASPSSTSSPSLSSTASVSATATVTVSPSASLSLSTSPSPLPCRHPDATRERALAWLKQIRCDHNPVDNMLYPNEGAAYTREYAVGKSLSGCQPVDSTLGDCAGEILFYHTCKPLVGKSAGPCKTQKDFLAAIVKFSCDQTIEPVDAECYTAQSLNDAVRSHSPFACASSSPRATHF